jgi:ectoine hydroxylase-related dioxygenase (phytanoyl-CoA dioxygenase family)
VMERLLGDEVYHYHHKMMLKEPRVGGAWEWHQDYGYWYNNGCLFPDMASCLIAVDRATRENGCLQVIRGSHRMGRVDHGKAGGQVGADQERVDAALQRMELVFCEMEPGDALFFHGNLLHRSDQNTSEHPRWSLICCYNTRHNDPYLTNGRHPNYTPLEKWADDRVRQALVG